jgi:2-oxoglutarate dehydrogenase E2 component (dihydrolipoamide succinyltransferase)
MGESIAEGTLSTWIKKAGDEVKRDEPIFEISTDKVDAEIPSPSAGILAEILVQEGETVEVNTVVARIETDASAAADAPPAEAAPAPAVEVAPAPAAAPAPPPAPSTPAAPAAAATAAPSGTEESADERLRRKSTPLVRKMAAEHDLDISAIPGTGHAGRVTKSDVLQFLDSPRAAAPPTVPTAPAAPAAAPAAPAPTVDPWEGDRVEPWSRIRKLTADHMIMSRRVSAHVQSFFEIDYTRVAEIRRRKKAEYAERGVKLTYLAFITKGVAECLRRHPGINAAVSGENTILRNDINIGMAVALDWGLIVPVIKHADELSLIGIARAINDLGTRARDKKLLPDEVQRGTFTITNPGGFGSYAGTPIINQPQVAILGVGAIEKRPAVITHPDGTDSLGIRTKGMLSMSYDHRVVDGADGDRFLADLKSLLENYPDEAT